MIDYVEGDTDPILIQLLSNGVPPVEPLTGGIILTVRNGGGVVIDTTGKVTIADATEWIIAYRPDPGDLLETGRIHRYHATVDQGGVERSFPGGPADGIEVSSRGGGGTRRVSRV